MASPGATQFRRSPRRPRLVRSAHRFQDQTLELPPQVPAQRLEQPRALADFSQVAALRARRYRVRPRRCHLRWPRGRHSRLRPRPGSSLTGSSKFACAFQPPADAPAIHPQSTVYSHSTALKPAGHNRCSCREHRFANPLAYSIPSWIPGRAPHWPIWRPQTYNNLNAFR
jgi:hypothetical protein